jgi:hypothetical protein
MSRNLKSISELNRICDGAFLCCTIQAPFLSETAEEFRGVKVEFLSHQRKEEAAVGAQIDRNSLPDEVVGIFCMHALIGIVGPGTELRVQITDRSFINQSALPKVLPSTPVQAGQARQAMI